MSIDLIKDMCIIAISIAIELKGERLESSFIIIYLYQGSTSNPNLFALVLVELPKHIQN